MDIQSHISQRLRWLRQQRGWSLERTAKETGVSKAMLGQIERGESSPTVAVLWRIASGLQASFSGFLPASDGEQVLLHHQDEGIVIVPLFAFDAHLGCEILSIELYPGYIHRSAPHGPGVVEHVLPIAGAMEVCLKEEWRPVTAAGLRFDASQPHAYRSIGEAGARFHNIVHYPAACGT